MQKISGKLTKFSVFALKQFTILEHGINLAQKFRYRVDINIETILWPSSIKIWNKKSGQSERALANIKDFKVGDN